MSRAAIGLGSNLGDRRAHLGRAIHRLADLGSVVAVSSLFETAPVGGPEQGAFLNAVVLLDTELPAEGLLGAMLAIEAEAGRVRAGRWGPRTLDLDLILMEGEQLDRPELTVPHPRARDRRFVLEPLAELWPGAEVAPGITAGAALVEVLGQATAAVGGWNPELGDWEPTE